MDDFGPEGVIAVMLLLFIVLVLPLLPGIFYLLTLQKALNRCDPRNRLMSPGLVWLMAIPFFNLIWHFVVVLNIAGSLSREYKDRGLETETEPGQALGLATCVLSLCTLMPYLGFLTALAALVCWICYWVRVAELSNQLATAPEDQIAETDGAEKHEPGYRRAIYAKRKPADTRVG